MSSIYSLSGELGWLPEGTDLNLIAGHSHLYSRPSYCCHFFFFFSKPLTHWKTWRVCTGLLVFVFHHQEHLRFPSAFPQPTWPLAICYLHPLVFFTGSSLLSTNTKQALHFTVSLTQTLCNAHGRTSINPWSVGLIIDSSQPSPEDAADKETKENRNL